ncbi:PAS domain-containing protein [Rhodoflexus sp.]
MESNQDYTLDYRYSAQNAVTNGSGNTNTPIRHIEDRLWIDAQISKFDNLLRTLYDKTLESFTDAIITDLSELVNAVKGVFFITDFEQHKVVASAGYACTLESLIKQEFAIGEDLVGYAVKSGKMRYLEDVGLQQTSIYSSLVSISTKAIVILPLVFNDLVYGVIELNCVRPLEEKQLELLKSLSRNIASMLQSIQNNARTKKLLEELRQKNNEMAQQEEELRQNLEELQSTQDAMELKQQEITHLLEEIRIKEANLNSIINNSGDQIFAVDTNLRVMLINQAMLENIRNTHGLDLQIGDDIRILFPPDQYDHWASIYQRALNGERILTELAFEQDGKKTYNEVMFNPIINDVGNIIGVAVFSRDITTRKMNELALQAQQVQMQEMIDIMERNRSYTIAIIDNFEDNILSFDLNYNILIHNKGLRELYKSMGVEIKTGMNVFDLILPEERDKFLQIYNRVIHNRETVTLDDSYTLNGKTLHLRMKHAPVISINDEVIGISAYSQVLENS